MSLPGRPALLLVGVALVVGGCLSDAPIPSASSTPPASVGPTPTPTASPTPTPLPEVEVPLAVVTNYISTACSCRAA
jgi:hypothetical protein